MIEVGGVVVGVVGVGGGEVTNKQDYQKSKTKQKSRKLVMKGIWEDQQSHLPQFLPTDDTQKQMTFTYDTTRFNFRELIISIFQCCCPGFAASTTDTRVCDEGDILEMIHTIIETPICPNRTVFHAAMNNIKNANTPREVAIYSRYKALLLDFVREIVAPLLNEEPDDVIFQRHPTLRVCLPSDLPMGVPHTDYEYHHMPSEVNIWLPLTRVYGANTLHTESRPGAADYTPVFLPAQALLHTHNT